MDKSVERNKFLSAGHISVKQFQVLVIEICFRQSIQGQHGEFSKQREHHGTIIWIIIIVIVIIIIVIIIVVPWDDWGLFFVAWNDS